MGEVALYLRVSTADQNLDRQLTSTQEYAERELDVSSWRVYDDKSTGTDVSRDGYQSLMSDVRAGEIEHVVAHQVSRVARSISDLEQTASQLREHGCALHVVQQGLEMRPGETDPYQRALFQLLGVFAELEAEIKRQNIHEGIAARQESEEYRHGPAPLGFEKDDGRLIEGESYHRVCSVLESVARDELSQRQAAKELGCGRKTVRRAVNERGELYGI
jgi:DNA invertase Pin-like site-specific DNA recombinase